MADTSIKLVTVNTAPERAKRLIGRVVEDVKDRFTIVHVANVESQYSDIDPRDADTDALCPQELKTYERL